MNIAPCQFCRACCDNIWDHVLSTFRQMHKSPLRPWMKTQFSRPCRSPQFDKQLNIKPSNKHQYGSSENQQPPVAGNAKIRKSLIFSSHPSLSRQVTVMYEPCLNTSLWMRNPLPPQTRRVKYTGAVDSLPLSNISSCSLRTEGGIRGQPLGNDINQKTQTHRLRQRLGLVWKCPDTCLDSHGKRDE